jgi:hypothetical protein
MEGRGGGIALIVDGQVVPAALEVFRQVAAANAILATGHPGAEELPAIVAAAWAAGVRKILINHPEHDVVGMTIEQQRELRREYPVFFERCYAQPAGGGKYRSNFETNLRAIELLGPESTVLASDVGQVENPAWSECWERTFEFFSAHGCSETTLRQMAGETPARLLGI